MKVLNLQCVHQHAFEGWFASEDDFQSQLERGLVECPMCGDPSVVKLPSAPRLNLSASRSVAPVAATPAPATTQALATGADQLAEKLSPEARAELRAAWLKLARHVMAHTEDVGEKFADEARRIHHGEAPERGIRGQASVEQARELLEEGIDVLPLPLPAAAKGTLQ